MSYGKLLYQRENVVVLRAAVLIVIVLFCRQICFWYEAALSVLHFHDLKLSDIPQFRNQMGFLKVRSQITVLRNIGEELESHDYIFVSRHTCE